jgi:hypothetical protein
MKKATCITVSVVAAVLGFLAAAALALGLVFGLGRNNNYNNKINNDTNYNTTDSTETTIEQATTASIVRTFVDNVTFPAGSYVIPLSKLSTDLSAQAPAIVNISVLTQVGT